MFAPLGFSLPLAFTKMRKLHIVAFLAFLLSFSLEFFQYFIGRSADIDDLLANVAGAAGGYCIYLLCKYFLKKRKMKEELNELH